MYRTIDLCAGIGGIRKGFERTGHFINVRSAEIDKYAAQTYELNFHENPLNDLTSTEFKDSLRKGDYDVLLAGFPCQPFSSQGNQDGFSDPTKGTIFFHIKQIIKKTRPKVVFLENVQNIVSHDGGNTMHVILDSFEKKLGYKVIGVNVTDNGDFRYQHSSFVRNTKNFGLPQNRPRAYFIAFDKSVYGELLDIIPNELPHRLSRRISEDPLLNHTLNDLIETEVDIHYYMSSQYLQTLKNHKVRQRNNGNGFGYCVVNSTEHISGVANTILATGGSGKERNLIQQQMPEYDLEDPKLITIIERKKGGLNNENIRIMTPVEWGRLQGFIGYGFVDPITGNDEFSFPPNMPEGQRYKQFGNSVSIPVIETMADFIYEECLVPMNKHHETIIMNILKRDGEITNQVVREHFDISSNKASTILKNMVKKKLIIKVKKGCYMEA